MPKLDNTNGFNIQQLPTAALVQEIIKREGVESTIAEPYQNVAVEVTGPAIVLTITD